MISLQELQSARQRRDPYAFYAQLHAEGAAADRLDPRIDKYDVIVYGYEAVDRLLKDHTTFQLMDAGYMDQAGSHWRDHIVLRTLKDSVFFVNGAVHARMRRLFGSVFTPRRVTGLEPAIGRITDALLDRMAELAAGGPVDFMAEFAFPLPSNVIGELLGVPEEDRAWFRPRVRTIGEIFELDGSTWSTMRAADEAAAELLDYFAALAAKRRADPTEDLVSALVQAHDEEGRLSDTELVANLLALFNAGFVTTTHLFGTGLTVLLERPEHFEALRTADDALATLYVEELLRYTASTHFLIRYATADTEVAGLPVKRGESVVVAIAAANRDPRRFPDPDRFDPYRPDNRPVTFGAGPHYCLGAALTRSEAKVAFPRLLNRYPDLRLHGDPGPPTRLQFRGYEVLPVDIRR